MSDIRIDPSAVRQATGSFSSKIVLIEGVSAAAQTAGALAAPLAHLACGLDGTLGALRHTVEDVRSDCNRLVRTMNECCAQYEGTEQSVYRLFGGEGTLYTQGSRGGILETFLGNIGNAVRSTIDTIKSAVERIDLGEFLLEGFWTAVEIAGWVGTIAAACALVTATAPVSVALGAVALVIGTVYLSNSIASRFTNLWAISQGQENPNENYLKGFLTDKLGGAGDFVYYGAMFLPAVLVAGGGAASVANASSTVTKANAAAIKEGAKVTGALSAPKPTGLNQPVIEAGKEAVHSIGKDAVTEFVLEPESHRLYQSVKNSFSGSSAPVPAGGMSGGGVR